MKDGTFWRFGDLASQEQEREQVFEFTTGSAERPNGRQLQAQGHELETVALRRSRFHLLTF